MLLRELFSNVKAHEVYHWTDADSMRKILHQQMIRVGACTHKINGETVFGISVSRNQYFDIEHTYAVSGRKAWRIGLDYNRLRQRFKIIPVRDSRYQNIEKTKMFQHPMLGQTYSDESEEYILNDVPLSYVTSVAVEDRWLDPYIHPQDAYANGTVEWEDQQLLMDILATEHPEMLNSHRDDHRALSTEHIELPHGVPLLCIQRDVPRVIPFQLAWSGQPVHNYR
jgi:hypothetical protein